MFCTNCLESLVTNFTVFSFFHKKLPDFGKNEGKNFVFIHINL